MKKIVATLVAVVILSSSVTLMAMEIDPSEVEMAKEKLTKLMVVLSSADAEAYRALVQPIGIPQFIYESTRENAFNDMAGVNLDNYYFYFYKTVRKGICVRGDNCDLSEHILYHSLDLVSSVYGEPGITNFKFDRNGLFTFFLTNEYKFAGNVLDATFFGESIVISVAKLTDYLLPDLGSPAIEPQLAAPPGPMGWKKPWKSSVKLMVGKDNPKSDAARPCESGRCGHTAGTSAPFLGNVIEEGVDSVRDPKYALDLLPVDFESYDPGKNPIFLHAPADGTIVRVNLDPTCPGSCVTGSGTFGNHIIVKTEDDEMYLMAHLAYFNQGREFTVNHGDNLGKASSRVTQGEFIGVLGSTATVGDSGQTFFSVPHLHFEVPSRSYKSGIGLFGMGKDEFTAGKLISGDF
ncbi:MAG: M23 family metallopeptidase [Deltaproteobacteria bacterium]|jgi:hypothetical protein|nr:M23 family metallopeptidase [Deltaproteobacteria bacterium]